MDICADANLLKIWRFIGILLDIAFIAVPIVLTVMGSVDFMKSTMAGKEDEIKKNQMVFIKRLIAGVIIFFIPFAVKIIMRLLDISVSPCLRCILDVSNC